MKYSYVLFVFCLMNCTSSDIVLDSQGHRGCRGLYPENTIEACIHALDLGVRTIELDCVISADGKVVVSHEAYFNHEMSTAPDGSAITKENEKEHNLYNLSYDSIKQYDVGTKPHPRFPDQKKMKVYKPLLSELVSECDTHATKTERDLPFYNIEIKRVASYDGKFNPPVEEFVDLVLTQISKLGIQERSNIQSFDLETLRIAHKKMPRMQTALLIENLKSPEENIKALGYTPDIYSCYFKLLNEESIGYLKSENIKIIPWTVNTKDDIKSTIELGVDGIISDFPDRVNEVQKELKM